MSGPFISRDFCESCAKYGKFERNQASWGAGDLLLAVATLGVWGLVKFLVNEFSNPWRCSACATPAKRSAVRGISRVAVALVVTVALSALLVWVISSHLPDLPR